MGTASEKALMTTVCTTAQLKGWLVYHTYDSRRSSPGFPDLCMVRGPRCIFAEIKAQRGKVTAEQQRWLDALRALSPTPPLTTDQPTPVEVYVWRPSDLDAIAQVLA